MTDEEQWLVDKARAMASEDFAMWRMPKPVQMTIRGLIAIIEEQSAQTKISDGNAELWQRRAEHAYARLDDIEAEQRVRQAKFAEMREAAEAIGDER